MKTTNEYKAAIADAVAFKHENPDENATTAAHLSCQPYYSLIKPAERATTKSQAWWPE